MKLDHLGVTPPKAKDDSVPNRKDCEKHAIEGVHGEEDWRKTTNQENAQRSNNQVE